MNKNISHIKDYFRMEATAFKARPYFWLLRIMFVALVLISGSIQWCFMIMGAIFSLGFLHSSEEERILPFTDEEFKKRKIIRVNMIWLRYLILGIGSYIVVFTGPYSMSKPETVMLRPYMYIAFFILQMAFVYRSLQEQIIDKTANARIFSKQPVHKYIFQSIPSIVGFVYGMSITKGPTSEFFIDLGEEWVHVTIMLVAALLLIVWIIKNYMEWKILDFQSDADQFKKAKGGRA